MNIKSLVRSLKNSFDVWLPTVPSLYVQYDRLRHKYSRDQKVYQAIICPGNTCIDVGANVGTHTAALARLVMPGGYIYAMEPFLQNVERATHANRTFSNVTIIPMAAANPTEDIETRRFSIPGADFTQGSLAKQEAGAWADATAIQTHEILCTSIDAQVRTKAIARVDFLKLDCEGGEMDAIRGGVETILRFKPIIYAEVFARWTKSFGYSPADLFQLLSEMGYTTGRVIWKGRIEAITFDQSITEAFTTSANVLCFSESVDSHRSALARFDEVFTR